MAKTKRPPQTRKKLGGPKVDGGPRQAKVEAVQEIRDRLAGSTATVLTEYRGMTVAELAELRASLRDAGTDYRVYKNTLATIAARESGLDELTAQLDGPTAFAFTSGDPVVTAKRLLEFAKRVPTLVVKGGTLQGRVLSAADVSQLGTLESREVMLAKTAGMFMSPIQQLANLFAAPLNQLGAMLAQLRDKTPAEPAGAEATEPAGPEATEATEPVATEATEPVATEATEAGEPAASAPTTDDTTEA